MKKAQTPCSAWELRRKMALLHGRKLTEELYQWFCFVKKTLSYESSGTWLLLSLPESEAIQVLKNAHERINGGGVPWYEFVETKEK